MTVTYHLTAMTYLDITTPISDRMVHWPDNAPVNIRRTRAFDFGDPANVSEISMSVHTATHVDAPRHFIKDGPDVTTLDLNTLLGPCRVARIYDPHLVTLAEVEPLDPQPGQRILFRTRNSDADWGPQPFNPDFVRLDFPAARFLQQRGVVCVGVDYLSVGAGDTHHALLDFGVTIIEGLRLGGVEPGDYELVCLPLKIVGADGAPCRALLRPL